MKALVTGATGFVGSHLVERLIGEGRQVVCLTRATSDPVWLDGLDVERRVAELDQIDALRRAVRGVDYVFHTAGLTRARSPREYLAVNAEGTHHLLQAVLAEGLSLRRFVYVSSLAAVGPAPSSKPPDEAAEPHPIDGYGASKLAGERAVLAHADRLPVTIVRPPAVYGPRDKNFLPLFRSAVRLGRVPVIGEPSKQAAFVYVTDLAEGIRLAAEASEGIGRTYFIAGGNHAMSQVVEAVCSALGMPARRLTVPSLLARLAGEIGQLRWAITGRPTIISRRKVRDMLQPRWTCSWARARRELGYRETVSLEEGMRRTVEWYIQQGWLAAR